jgi:lysozyme
MKTSTNGIAFIKRHEGLRLQAYQCSAGKWTIGYGHTGGVQQGDAITLAQANAYLVADLAKFEAAVNAAGIPNLRQNQFDALVSLVYNIGVANFITSQLYRKVKENPNDSTLRVEFMKFIHANKKPNEGLRKRRAAEVELYFKII